MPRLPDVRLNDWLEDQKKRFEEATAGYLPALDFDLQGRMDEASIPPDYDAPGGMDQWEEAEKNVLEQQSRIDQQREQERIAQEQQQLEAQYAQEQVQAKAQEQAAQQQQEQSMLDHARSLGIPTPGDVFKDRQSPGDNTSSSGIFDARQYDEGPHELPPPQFSSPQPQAMPDQSVSRPLPQTDVEAFNDHTSSMLSDMFGLPPDPDSKQPPERDDTSSSGILDRVGSAASSVASTVKQGAESLRAGVDQLGTAIEDSPYYPGRGGAERVVNRPFRVQDIPEDIVSLQLDPIGAARQAERGARSLVENYGVDKVARDLQRKEELQQEIDQQYPAQSPREIALRDMRPIPEAWAAANPEKARELEELRASEQNLIMGASNTMGGGGMAEDAISAIKTLLSHGLDDAAAASERNLAQKSSMTLEEIQKRTRGLISEAEAPVGQAVEDALSPETPPRESTPPPVGEPSPTPYSGGTQPPPPVESTPYTRGLTTEEAEQMGLPGFENVPRNETPQPRAGIRGFGTVAQDMSEDTERGIRGVAGEAARERQPYTLQQQAEDVGALLDADPEAVKPILGKALLASPQASAIEQGMLRENSRTWGEAWAKARQDWGDIQEEIADLTRNNRNIPDDVAEEATLRATTLAAVYNELKTAVKGQSLSAAAHSRGLNAQRGARLGAAAVAESKRLDDIGDVAKKAAKSAKDGVVDEDALRDLGTKLGSSRTRKAVTGTSKTGESLGPGTGEGGGRKGSGTPRTPSGAPAEPREETLIERLGRLMREQGTLENRLEESSTATGRGARTSVPNPLHVTDPAERGVHSGRLAQVRAEIENIHGQMRTHADELAQQRLAAKANRGPLTVEETERIVNEAIGRKAQARMTREATRKARGLTGDEAGITKGIKEGIDRHYKTAQSNIQKEFEKIFTDEAKREAKMKLWHDRRVDGILSQERNAKTRREVKNMAQTAQDWAKNIRDDANPRLSPERRAELDDLKKDFNFQEELDAALGQMKAHSSVGDRVATDLEERLGVNLQEDTYNRAFRDERAAGREITEARIRAVRQQIQDVLDNPRAADRHTRIAELYQDLEDIGDQGKKRASDMRRRAHEQGILKSGLDSSGKSSDELAKMMASVDPNDPNSFKPILELMARPNAWGVLREISFINMLSNARTHATNITSTSANGLLQLLLKNPVKQVFSGGELSGTGAAFKGLVAGAGEGVRLAGKTMTTGINPRRLESAAATGEYQHIGRELLPEVLGKVKLGKLGQAMHVVSTRPLEAMDALMGNMMYSSATHQLAQRKADDLIRAGEKMIDGVPIQNRQQAADHMLKNIWDHPEIIKEAGKIEDYTLFRSRDPGGFETILRRLMGMKELGPNPTTGEVVRAALIDMVMPFFNVPYNFTKQGLGNVVGGPLGTMGYARALLKGDNKAAGEQAARAAQGAAMMAIPAYFAMAGERWDDNITAQGPTDPGDRRVWLEGHRPYSFRWPGTEHWISYEGTPWAIPFATVAGGTEAIQQQQDKDPNASPTAKAVGIGLGALQGAGQGALSQTFMEGAMRNYEALTGDIKGPNAGAQFLAGTATRYAPSPVPTGLLNFLAGVADSSERDPGRARSLDDVPAVTEDIIKSRIPGLRNQLPERRGAFGEVVENPYAGGWALTPKSVVGARAPGEGDPIVSQLERGGVGIPNAPEALSIPGGGSVPITIREQQQFQQIYGETYHLYMERMRARAAEKNLPMTEKDLIGLRDEARKVASATIQGQLGIEEMRRRYTSKENPEVAP